jgi:methylenetetrahydrofolate dehydrogenase (NADP+)/methenyltetrahydrofolate cyclohydrolase
VTERPDPKIIDGKAASKQILAELAEEVHEFSLRFRPPHLAVILVGDDPASEVYVRGKMHSAKKSGIESTQITLPADTSEETVLGKIESLNGDGGVDGVLVQLPLPAHIDQQRVIERIAPSKDVDGFHPYNLGRLAADKPVFIPCTPCGIRELLARYDVSTEGKHAVVIGRSIIVGKPMALLLARKGASGNATVTLCHSRTADLEQISSRADILVAAIGRAEFVKGEMVKEGAVVIDVGVNRVDDPASEKGYRLVGDVDFDSAYSRASLITPVPGGVGPMTRAMLMKNTFLAAKRALGEVDDS